MKIGIYCTVNKVEFRLALSTLHFASLSSHVSHIAILITDGEVDEAKYHSKKITIYSQNFGVGYNISIADGGYDQVAARNFLIEKLTATDADWIMMHDADDIYALDYYRFITERCATANAVTCSCFSLRPGPEVCVPQAKTQYWQGKTLYDPHTRIWKKTLGLRYEKSEGIEKYFPNHSRHCGVNFPAPINIFHTDGLYHFHLHALLNKRHSEKIAAYSRIDCIIPESINNFLEENKELFP